MCGAHRRAALALEGLWDAVGMKKSADELLAAAVACDRDKIVVLLRHYFHALFPYIPTGIRKTLATTQTDTTTPQPKPKRTLKFTSESGTDATEGGSSIAVGTAESINTADSILSQLHDGVAAATPRAAAAEREGGHSRGGPFSQRHVLRLGLDIADSIGGGGAQVMGVEDGSLGARMGLCAGDSIVQVNGTPVDTCQQFVEQYRKTTSGCGNNDVVLAVGVRTSTGRNITRRLFVPSDFSNTSEVGT